MTRMKGKEPKTEKERATVKTEAKERKKGSTKETPDGDLVFGSELATSQGSNSSGLEKVYSKAEPFDPLLIQRKDGIGMSLRP